MEALDREKERPRETEAWASQRRAFNCAITTYRALWVFRNERLARRRLRCYRPRTRHDSPVTEKNPGTFFMCTKEACTGTASPTSACSSTGNERIARPSGTLHDVYC